ncbi:MAG: GNAT family N-acetyltransferase [Myxococcota bacterium]
MSKTPTDAPASTGTPPSDASAVERPPSPAAAASSLSFVHITDGRVRIGPPNDDALAWVLEHLSRPEIAQALGWETSIGAEIYSGYIDETVLLLPFSRGDAPPVGFVMLMRPDLSVRTWTVNVAVPQPGHRDGFTALAALDAMCHLVFDLRGDDGLEWLIEPSNRASQALPKRLGYPRIEQIERQGTRYDRFAIELDGWQARQQRVAARGRPLAYDVQPVPLEAVAHSAIIRAVRGRAVSPPTPSASLLQRVGRRVARLLGR